MLSSCWWGTPPLQSWSSGGRSSRFDSWQMHVFRWSVMNDGHSQLWVWVFLLSLSHWMSAWTWWTRQNFRIDRLRLTQRRIDGESRADSVERIRSQSSSLEQFVSREIWTEMKCVWSCSLYPPLSLSLSLSPPLAPSPPSTSPEEVGLVPRCLLFNSQI